MSDKAESVLIGALAGAAATLMVGGLPFVGTCLCCLAILAAPTVTSWHYKKSTSMVPPTSTHVKMGAATGAMAAILWYLSRVLLRAIGLAPSAAETREEMQEQMMNQMMDNPQFSTLSPEDAQVMEEAMMQVVTLLNGPGLLMIVVPLEALLGAVGGAIAASVFTTDEV